MERACGVLNCGHFPQWWVTANFEWIERSPKFRWVLLFCSNHYCCEQQHHNLESRFWANDTSILSRTTSEKGRSEIDRDWTLIMSKLSSLSKLSFVLCQATVIYWLCCRGLKACVGASESQQDEGDRIRTPCILASQGLSTHQVKGWSGFSKKINNSEHKGTKWKELWNFIFIVKDKAHQNIVHNVVEFCKRHLYSTKASKVTENQRDGKKKFVAVIRCRCLK